MHMDWSPTARRAATVIAFLAALQPTPSPTPTPTPAPTQGPFTYDVEVFGASTKAKAGSIVEITVGARNHGSRPTPWVGGQLGVDHRFAVTLPPGTALPEPPHCAAVQFVPPQFFSCSIGVLEPGQELTLTFAVRVDKARHNATGRITRTYDPLLHGSPDTDTNRTNDTADIVIDSGETLPQTGPHTVALVAGGLGAIAIGSLVLFVLSRRLAVTRRDEPHA